jgi:lysophospholipase L1-like esterase
VRIALATLLALLTLAAPAAAGQARPPVYVSLGDSYAVGYQPNPAGTPGGATQNGYADQLVPLVRARGYTRLRLVNFGCGGATTQLVITGAGCGLPAIGGAAYRGRSQLRAAERYLRRNRRRVALVTIAVGGNDATSCVRPGVDPVACVTAAAGMINRNVRIIARRVRRAVGPRVRIVGLTYPDVLLGLFTTGQPADQQLAGLSVAAFRTLVNPALADAYDSADARFLDVTAATDAYVPFTETTDLPPYGIIPVAVARACQLSFYCELRDIHLRTEGYTLMANLIAAALPRRRG